jgi:hypothetical protein
LYDQARALPGFAGVPNRNDESSTDELDLLLASIQPHACPSNGINPRLGDFIKLIPVPQRLGVWVSARRRGEYISLRALVPERLEAAVRGVPGAAPAARLVRRVVRSVLRAGAIAKGRAW